MVFDMDRGAMNYPIDIKSKEFSGSLVERCVHALRRGDDALNLLGIEGKCDEVAIAFASPSALLFFKNVIPPRLVPFRSVHDMVFAQSHGIRGGDPYRVWYEFFRLFSLSLETPWRVEGMSAPGSPIHRDLFGGNVLSDEAFVTHVSYKCSSASQYLRDCDVLERAGKRRATCWSSYGGFTYFSWPRGCAHPRQLEEGEETDPIFKDTYLKPRFPWPAS